MDWIRKTGTTVAFLGILSVIGCRRHDTRRALATAPSTAARASSSASSRPPICNPGVPGFCDGPDKPGASPSEWGPNYELTCDQAPLRKLQAAIAHLDDDPPSSDIERVEHPIAYAYTAFLRWARGDEAGSNSALHRIPYDVADFADVFIDSQDSRAQQLLTFVWAAQERYSCPMPAGTGAETWCGMFDKYTVEAISAFSQEGTGPMVAYSADQKHHCAERLVRDHASPELARDFAVAHKKLVRAIYDVAPPGSGTMWGILACIIGDLLEEPVFGFSRVRRPDPKNFDKALYHAGSYLRDLDARVARLRRLEARSAPVLATVFCKMAAYHGRSMSNEECRANADARLESALQMWLEEEPYTAISVDAKGKVHVPEPWR